MSERYKGFVVTLDADIREDDAEGLVNAIRHIRGVASVEPVRADIAGDSMIRSRVRLEMVKDLGDLISKWLSR
jgi:hypothetical protein